MIKFLKKVGCQQFWKHYFRKWSKALASRSLSFSYFKILFSKTPHIFRKFCHLKISTYTVLENMDTWINHTLSYGLKLCFIWLGKLGHLDNGTTMIGPNNTMESSLLAREVINPVCGDHQVKIEVIGFIKINNRRANIKYFIANFNDIFLEC